MGNMPKDPFVGAHLKPNIIFFSPTLIKSGDPSIRINIKIRNRKSNEDNANIVSTVFTICSFIDVSLVIGTH